MLSKKRSTFQVDSLSKNIYIYIYIIRILHYCLIYFNQPLLISKKLQVEHSHMIKHTMSTMNIVNYISLSLSLLILLLLFSALTLSSFIDLYIYVSYFRSYFFQWINVLKSYSSMNFCSSSDNTRSLMELK